MDENLANSETSSGLEIEEGFEEATNWDCSVCTYKNPPAAFKCLMCDVRKGTSTRKPRLNQQIVAKQVAQQFVPATGAAHGKKPGASKRAVRKFRPRLKNVDRNSAQEISVTVGNVTVIITDYKLLQSEDGRTLSDSFSNSDESLASSGISYQNMSPKGPIASVGS